MESVVVLWAFILLLPIIITAALCIRCRERAPTQITQSVDDYESNPAGMMSPGSHSSFTVLRPSNYVHKGVSTSFLSVRSLDPILSVRNRAIIRAQIPRNHTELPKRTCSLHQPDSRRNSSTIREPDNDSAPSYENTETVEVAYANDDYTNGYIYVLPDNTEAVTCQSTSCDSADSAIRSSTDTGDYQNVPEQQSASPGEDTSTGDSLDYVNVPQKLELELAQPKGHYDDVRYHSSDEDDDDDTPDYENIEKKSRG